LEKTKRGASTANFPVDIVLTKSEIQVCLVSSEVPADKLLVL